MAVMMLGLEAGGDQMTTVLLSSLDSLAQLSVQLLERRGLHPYTVPVWRQEGRKEPKNYSVQTLIFPVGTRSQEWLSPSATCTHSTGDRQGLVCSALLALCYCLPKSPAACYNLLQEGYPNLVKCITLWLDFRSRISAPERPSPGVTLPRLEEE